MAYSDLLLLQDALNFLDICLGKLDLSSDESSSSDSGKFSTGLTAQTSFGKYSRSSLSTYACHCKKIRYSKPVILVSVNVQSIILWNGTLLLLSFEHTFM